MIDTNHVGFVPKSCGLPVALFAIELACGAKLISTVTNRVGAVEPWARRATDVVFIAVGVYFTCDRIFELF